MSTDPGATRDAGLLVVAGALVVVATTFATARLGPLGIIAGPAVDVAVLPWAARLVQRSYRSPGAPLWAAAFGICALLPAATTWASPDAGLLFTATDALPAIVLSALGWRRPLARVARLGGAIALVALVVSMALFAAR